MKYILFAIFVGGGQAPSSMTAMQFSREDLCVEASLEIAKEIGPWRDLKMICVKASD